MMDNETIKELAEGVNGGIIAATKRLERAIMKLKAENKKRGSQKNRSLRIVNSGGAKSTGCRGEDRYNSNNNAENK